MEETLLQMQHSSSCCTSSSNNGSNTPLSQVSIRPCYSILNVVIDYVMTTPTPFEWVEFEKRHRQSMTRIPVIRVFGPLVKHYERNCVPRQSGCVHIHNVFPYFLARPQFMSHGTSNGERHPRHHHHHQQHQDDYSNEALDLFLLTALRINWDQYESIDSSLDSLRHYLEQSCVDVYLARRTMFPQTTTATAAVDGHAHEPRKSTMNTPDFIRDITVCSGRAFYTYDPDPPGFFLRIEYYNPQDRHMIRALLQNSAGPDNNNNNNNTDTSNAHQKPKFHCFEAHIPYTMQFFKDYNLAGLKYIHLAAKEEISQENKLLFRTPLPLAMTHNSLYDEEEDDSNCYILQDNTPNELLWNEFLQRHKNDVEILKTYTPPVKVTGCDNGIVEFDIDASAILNVHQILTSEDITATQKLDETRNIHWRAVPSLREIWEEEKARMEILLKDFPEENFLSEQEIQSRKKKKKRGRDDDGSNNIHNNKETIILAQLSDEKQNNVQQHQQQQRMSGTKQAIKGMCSLFCVGVDGKSDSVDTPQISLLFNLYRRAMMDILQRHQQIVEVEEMYWRDRCAPTALIMSTSSSPNEERLSKVVLSDEQYSFLENLGALQCQFFASPIEQLTTTLTQPRYYSGDASSCKTTPTTADKQTFNNPLISEFTPPTPQQLSFSTTKQKVLAFQQQQRSATRKSGPQFTPQITKPLCEDTLRRTQTQIVNEMLLDALVWEEGGENDEEDDENQTEESLTQELRNLEVETTSKNLVSLKRHTIHEVIELNTTLPSRSQCLPSNRSAWCLGYSGEFDKLKKIIDGQPYGRGLFLSPDTTASWWEPACAPPCPKGIRTHVAKPNRIEENISHGIGKVKAEILAERSGLKPSVPPTTKKKWNGSKLQIPLTIMSVEIHVQCRLGKTGSAGIREVAMTPNPDRDTVFAIVYVLAKDPGGGRIIEITEKKCFYVPVEVESSHSSIRPIVKGKDICIERVPSERDLFHRFASIVRVRDPDILLSWDTHGAGIGYLIKRGVALGEVVDRDGQGSKCRPIDMVRLLGRTPKATEETNVDIVVSDSLTQSISQAVHGNDSKWKGSGLGTEWDDLKGSGAAASSIIGRLVWCGWKITSEEVKHPLASYQNAMVSTVLQKRIPCVDGITLNRWYGAENGHQRFRVLQHRLDQAVATLLIMDELDIIGRTGETARLSGIEFSQSLPGIRGSQYKVEGVLLRALQSVASDERGLKRGKNKSEFSGPSSSLSGRSDTQAPSPWKLRRNFARHLAGQRLPDSLGTHSDREKEVPQCSSQVGLLNRGYFFFSLGKEDKDHLEPLRVQALTLEPESGFHDDPVVVCDFTALYPSLVIAYNLCYTTCAGQIEYTSLREESAGHGITTGRIGPFLYPENLTASILKQHVKSLSNANTTSSITEDRAYVAPNGAIFVGESVLKGVLPQVLSELLTTRAMIKRAAKIYKLHGVESSVLRQLEARQLALKYVANVTYGYTSATFSGRSAMPVLADAIVECARRTLTNAIKIAEKWGKEKGGKWEGAKVVYGDTDSIFVKLPGRTVEEAFTFGRAFCKEVTFSNPPPVELKLEKVYRGVLLQTKKRYAGMKFESPNEQAELESKGIETIRQDQCNLTKKILSQALVTVFEQGKDALKDLLERQWTSIYAGRHPVSDFILTGRVRDKYRKGAEKSPPVAAALVRRLAESDPGLVIRDKERVAYVIIASPGRKIRLSDCVVTPIELLEQWDSYRINVAYYITKQLNAALQRCFSLPPYHIDVHKWYEACPKPRKRIHFWPTSSACTTSMITTYFGSDICTLCNRKCKMVGKSKLVVCKFCKESKASTVLYALERCSLAQHEAHELAKICKACTGCPETGDSFAVEIVTRVGKMARTVATPLANCVCTDCPITFERHKAKEELLFADELCKALNLSW